MKKNVLLLLFLIIGIGGLKLKGQETDSLILSKIYKNALSNFNAYNGLNTLCSEAPGRMIGTPESEKAIEIFSDYFNTFGTDSLYKQEYYGPAWLSISQSKAYAEIKGEKHELSVEALGNSVSSPPNGLKGELLEVHSLDTLDVLGEKEIKGKIVFFNRAMNNSFIEPFDAYSEAIDQRVYGASKAARYGAVGALVRSLSTEQNDYPHTGVSRNNKVGNNIPNLSISTLDADKLSQLNKINDNLTIWLQTKNKHVDSVKTCNLISELKGSEFPDKIIVLGGHIDTWYNSPGAHDDGAGCFQAADVIRIFNELHIKPRHTIRVVMFMDEELNQTGAAEYERNYLREGKEHLIAIESDAGAFSPRGFSIEASDTIINKLQLYAELLTPYGITDTKKGFSGVDIRNLGKYNVPLAGMKTDSQRYFDYHHAASDTPDQVHRRQMQMGTASIASLVYLVDKYGL